MFTTFDENERLARLRLIRSENVGPVNFARLIERFGTANAAVEALPEIAVRAGRKNLRVATAGEAEREWSMTEKAGAGFVMLGEADYPPLLAEVEGAPPVLTYVGNLAHLQKPAIAIVGARNASANGKTMSRRIASGLAENGITVVSGLARGIDSEAHLASVETATVAVIAGGIDVIYPPENHDLQHQIATGGLLLAESPFGTQPRARHFPRRNRIISGVSLGVVVIEAAMRSGSLITARQAGEQGRDVFAIPGSPLDPRSRGANRLIRDGAHLIESADDVLDHIGPQGLFERRPAPPRADQDQVNSFDGKNIDDVAGRQSILEAMSAEPTDADTLIRSTGLAPSAFHGLVLELEIVGAIERHAGNRYALRLEG